jgi:hypothetical protein
VSSKGKGPLPASERDYPTKLAITNYGLQEEEKKRHHQTVTVSCVICDVQAKQAELQQQLEQATPEQRQQLGMLQRVGGYP